MIDCQFSDVGGGFSADLPKAKCADSRIRASAKMIFLTIHNSLCLSWSAHTVGKHTCLYILVAADIFKILSDYSFFCTCLVSGFQMPQPVSVVCWISDSLSSQETDMAKLDPFSAFIKILTVAVCF